MEDVTITKLIKTFQFEAIEEGIGFFASPEDKAVGVASSKLKIGILKDVESGKEMLIVGNVFSTPEGGTDGFGIAIDETGLVSIKGSVLKVVKQEFVSHEAATETVESGEEYYLVGDRNVYRKP
jgi:hypothetical protein